MKHCIFSIIYFGFFSLTQAYEVSFKGEEFLAYLKKQTNILKDYQLPAFIKDEVKYSSRYVSSKGAGFYLMVQDKRLIKSPSPPSKNVKLAEQEKEANRYHEQWGPYKSMQNAKDAEAGIPKDSVYKVLNIVYSSGDYSTQWYELQKSLNDGKDKSLTDCYIAQVNEFEKAKNDEQLGRFFNYIRFEDIKIQLVDLRAGLPEMSPMKQLFAFQNFTISAVLDDKGICKLTTLSDLKTILSSHIEHHKKLLAAMVVERMDSEKRDTRYSISSEMHEQLKKQIEALRTQETTKKVAPRIEVKK